MSNRQRLINLRLQKSFPVAVKGEGIYIYDSEGRRYLDGCSGALVANLGHGVSEIARALAVQAQKLPFVYRNHFSSPAAEALADRFCSLTREPMGGAYFTNSGSEATETAVKLARVHHLASGEYARYKIISRWQRPCRPTNTFRSSGKFAIVMVSCILPGRHGCRTCRAGLYG